MGDLNHFCRQNFALLGDYLQRSRFGKNVATLLVGNSIAYAIALVSIPLITRLYTPSSYAVLSVFIGLVTLLQSFASLRFEWCIPNASTHAEAKQITRLAFIILGIFTVCSMPAFLFVGQNFQGNYWINQLNGYLWLAPIGILLAATLEVMNAWPVRLRDMRPQARAMVYQNASGSTVQIFGGIIGSNPLFLIAGFFTNKALGSLVLAKNLSTHWHGEQQFRPESLRSVFKRHAQTGITSSLVSAVNGFSLNLPVFLFAIYYGATQTGIMAMALRLASIAPLLFGRAVSQSFWAEAAILVKENPKALLSLYMKTTLRLCIIAIPICIGCLIAPKFIHIILGGKLWASVGNILLALTPLILGKIIVSSLSHLIVHEKQHWQLCWDISRAALTAVALILAGTMGFDPTVAAFSFAIIAAFMYVVLFLLNRAAIKQLIVSMKPHEC